MDTLEKLSKKQNLDYDEKEEFMKNLLKGGHRSVFESAVNARTARRRSLYIHNFKSFM
jgi:hypothetical protein